MAVSPGDGRAVTDKVQAIKTWIKCAHAHRVEVTALGDHRRTFLCPQCGRLVVE
jgi:predicted RNA-binding Zn-ribbon protein involved in translation (DUF1610 family)